MVLIQCRCREATNIYFFVVFVTILWFSLRYCMSSCHNMTALPQCTTAFWDPWLLTDGTAAGSEQCSKDHHRKLSKRPKSCQAYILATCIEIITSIYERTIHKSHGCPQTALLTRQFVETSSSIRTTKGYGDNSFSVAEANLWTTLAINIALHNPSPRASFKKNCISESLPAICLYF